MKHEIGDLLFVYDPRWYNLVSTSIMICETDKITHGKVPHHVAIVYDDEHLIEATWGHGVTKIPINYYDRKPLTTWWKRLKDEYWPNGDKILNREILQNYLTQQIGKPYDKKQIVSIFLRSFLRCIPPIYRIIKNTTSILDSRFAFICSEIIYRAYCSINLDIYPSATASTITPFDLDKSQCFEIG